MTDTPPPEPPTQPQQGGAAPVGKVRSVGWTIFLAIITFGIWTWPWSYWNGEELKRYRPAGLGGVGYLLITIFIHPVTMFLMASEVEQLYREDNREPAITTLWGLWFLLPLIGNIIWYVRIQNAINEFWIAHGADPEPGIA
jgi:hypothetical protein